MHTDLHGFFLKLGSHSSSTVDFVGSCLDTCWALIGFRNGFTPMRRSSGAPEDHQAGTYPQRITATRYAAEIPNAHHRGSPAAAIHPR